METETTVAVGDIVDTVTGATPEKRTGKKIHVTFDLVRMVVFRRTATVVSRKDVAGPRRGSEFESGICPISGPGNSQNPKRNAKAKEVIGPAERISVEHFEKGCVQSLHWHHVPRAGQDVARPGTDRKRKPVAPSTLATWESCLEIGSIPTSVICPSQHQELGAQRISGVTMVKGGWSVSDPGLHSSGEDGGSLGSQ